MSELKEVWVLERKRDSAIRSVQREQPDELYLAYAESEGSEYVRYVARPTPSEQEVEDAARRAAGAGWLVDGERLNRSWDMAPEAVREHFRRMARAALGVGE